MAFGVVGVVARNVRASPAEFEFHERVDNPRHHLVPLPIPHLLKTSEPRARHTTNTHTHTRHALHRPPSSSPHPLYISNAPDAVSTRRRRPPSITPAQRALRVRSLASAIDPGHFSGTFLEDRACVPSTGSELGRWHPGEGMGKRRAHLLTHHSAFDAPAVPDPGTTGANDAADQVAGAAITACRMAECRAAPRPRRAPPHPCSPRACRASARSSRHVRTTGANDAADQVAGAAITACRMAECRAAPRPRRAPPHPCSPRACRASARSSRHVRLPSPRRVRSPSPHPRAQVHAGPAVHVRAGPTIYVRAGPTVQPARTPRNSVQAPPYTFVQAPLLLRTSATTQPAPRMPRNSAQPRPSTFAQHPPSPHTFAPAPWHHTCISASA
ncbi:hypothetical protein PLICRDRAFT_175109 [Plicaturopsis crispa FD-325 SS-3]|nr:hypothetical protein PLICRDRAFT_175109 [Plicaturopsis crispa FD-325 SS-3]